MKNNAWYLILLPVFFVLHGLVENFGFVGIGDSVLLCLYYLLITAALYLIAFLLFKNSKKSALFTFCPMAFYFFYGAIHEFLKSNVEWRFVSRHGFLLTTFLLLFIILFIYLKRSIKQFPKLILFLNILLFIYITGDLVSLIQKSFRAPQNALSVYHFSNTQYQKCDSCSKPDIYLLLFDEYSSSLALKEEYGFHNDLDSFLVKKKFRIQQESQSNYNFTPFSMASLLNMSYISGIPNVNAINPEDYSRSYQLIRQNELIKFLDVQGYDIRNYSIFDLAGHPTLVKQSLLPLNTMLISERTLIPHLRKDIGWIFINNFPFNIFFKNHFIHQGANNEKLINLVERAASEAKSRPVFVYAHLELPHAPFLFDKNGKARENKTVYLEYTGTAPPSSYLGYVEYTNSRIIEMVNEIQQKDPAAYIILLGDHGYRTAKVSTDKRLFQNLNAVYFPDGDYHALYDSITNVNEFRIVANKIFHANLPLQKDSTIVLHDRK